MSEKSDNRLTVNIKVSLLLTTTLAAVHLGGMLLVGILDIALPLKLGLWLALLASAAGSLRHHGLRVGTHAVTALEWDSEGFWSVRQGQADSWREAELERAVVLPWLVILTLRTNERRRRLGLVLAKDAVDPEAFRRLRARLRLQSRAG